MLNETNRRWMVPLIAGLLVLAGDQITKLWIVRELGPEPLLHFKSIIGDWVRLVYSQNTGVAFNLFQDKSHIFIVTSLLISAGAIYIYATYLPNHNPLVQASIGLILGGALGNTIDRVRVGYVIDFIQVGWWPVFNVADSAISVGAAILALCLLLATEQRTETPSPHDDVLLQDLLHHDVGNHEQ